MADSKITYIIGAEDQTKAAIKSVEGRLDSAKSKIQNMQPTFKKMAVAGTVAFAGISAAIYDVVKAANTQMRVEGQLDAVIKSTGGAAGLTAEEVKSMARGLQQVTAVGDEAIITGQNMLLSFTQIGKEVFPKATETLLDMATAMNAGAIPTAEQLNTQAIQLGKALNDPIAGLGALSRVGVKFTDTQKEMITTMVEAGDVTGAQKVILDELAVEFGGRARSSVETFEGRMAQLNNRFGDFKERIGTAVIPILEKMLEKAIPVVEKVIDWIDAHPKLTAVILVGTAAIAGLVAILGVVGLVLPAVITGVQAFGTALMFLAANPIGIIVVAIGAVIAALVWLAKNSDMVNQAIRNAWEGIKKTTGAAVDWLIGKMQPLINIYSRVASAAGKIPGLTGVIRGAASTVSSFIGPLIPKFAMGGIVPGRIGAPTLAVVHGGEKVTPAGKSNEKTGNVFTFNFNGDVTDREALIREVVEALNRATAVASAGSAW